MALGFRLIADLAAAFIELRFTAAVNFAGFFTFFPDELEYIEAPVAAYAFGFRTFVPCLVRQPLLRLLWTLFPRAFALVLQLDLFFRVD